LASPVANVSGEKLSVASANAAYDVMAVVTTVTVAVVTKANTKAKRMKILRMIVPVSLALLCQGAGNDL
jgi:hypothetical protein